MFQSFRIVRPVEKPYSLRGKREKAMEQHLGALLTVALQDLKFHKKIYSLILTVANLAHLAIQLNDVKLMKFRSFLVFLKVKPQVVQLG